jgi:glycosyltransferase involved in cell wall biosynthesis
VVPATFARRNRTVVCIQHILRPARERPGPYLPNLISQVFQSISFALVRRFAKAVLVNTSETSRIIQLDPERTKSYIMTHGVYHEDAALSSARPNVPSAVYLGRLVPTKGVDDLLRAWRLVCDEIPNADLQIVGGGEDRYERSLRDLTSALGLSESVRFTGRVSDDAKRRALKSASIFVFPSKEEGWGIAIGEAMAYGLPCVVYNLPAYRDVFVKGCLTAPLGDVSALASHIISLFRDTETAARLSKEASELSETFSWDRAALIERRALQELTS